nr:MAG TPA: hypothetical protein [Bacteriophage sp.]
MHLRHSCLPCWFYKHLLTGRISVLLSYRLFIP